MHTNDIVNWKRKKWNAEEEDWSGGQLVSCWNAELFGRKELVDDRRRRYHLLDSVTCKRRPIWNFSAGCAQKKYQYTFCYAHLVEVLQDLLTLLLVACFESIRLNK